MRLIEHRVEVDGDQARQIFSAFDITSHPVKGFGDACQHAYSRSTQVSLLPPPCDEFTTSDPLRSATRVRPPGTIVTFYPYKMYGRRSMWQPSNSPSNTVGGRLTA